MLLHFRFFFFFIFIFQLYCTRLLLAFDFFESVLFLQEFMYLQICFLHFLAACFHTMKGQRFCWRTAGVVAASVGVKCAFRLTKMSWS